MDFPQVLRDALLVNAEEIQRDVGVKVAALELLKHGVVTALLTQGPDTQEARLRGVEALVQRAVDGILAEVEGHRLDRHRIERHFLAVRCLVGGRRRHVGALLRRREDQGRDPAVRPHPADALQAHEVLGEVVAAQDDLRARRGVGERSEGVVHLDLALLPQVLDGVDDDQLNVLLELLLNAVQPVDEFYPGSPPVELVIDVVLADADIRL
mmetsp:Transcript_40629/g.127097  ORF Transcript_40629/g.127097 Transcript_40629/m.127097 type:complete len:211 (+) Transcript_40629:548-1180(+)